MSKSKTKQSKAEINKQINKRATKSQIDAIVKRTIELLQENKTYSEVKDALRREVKKGDRQLERYIQRAFEEIRSEFEDDIAKTRTQFVQGLMGDYKEAIRNYRAIPDPENRMKATWFKMALEVKDRIERFIPKLADEVESEDIVQVAYNVIPLKASGYEE